MGRGQMESRMALFVTVLIALASANNSVELADNAIAATHEHSAEPHVMEGKIGTAHSESHGSASQHQHEQEMLAGKVAPKIQHPRTKLALEHTSVAVGHKKNRHAVFASPAVYHAYMKKLLKNGYAVPASASAKLAPAHGDVTVDGDLGETVSREHIPEIPAVREISRDRPAKQSSIEYGAAAALAVDGRTDGVFSHRSCTHTTLEKDPWWRVDLGKTMNIQHIEVYSRADCCGESLASFQVYIGDSTEWQKNPKCGTQWSVKQGESTKIPCAALQGQYVFVVVKGTKVLTLCEVKVFGSDNPGANAAKGMKAKQSSTTKGGSADRAVDGHTTMDFSQGSCTHTEYELKPWWRVDLARPQTVAAVQIWNRGDCCGSRLSDFTVRVGNNQQEYAGSRKCGNRWAIPQGEHREISCGGQNGRYVWVVLEKRATLTLCEVRVLTTYAKKGVNIARNKPTEQSSTGYGGDAKKAVDGNVETNYKAGSCTHTHFDPEPWWRVDLEAPQAIGAVQIWNRGDCCGSRLSNFEVRVGDGTKWQGTKVCGDKRQKIAQGKRKSILCGGTQGRYVYVVKRNTGYLNLCEVRVLPWKGPQENADGVEGCISKALGVESRAIKAGDMFASSFYGNQDEFGPNNGRLNYRGASWQPLHERVGEWLQVTLPKLYKVTAVSTQGDFEADKWVTGYKVRYLNRLGRWKYVGDGSGITLQGNTDRNTAKKNTFQNPVEATKIRFYPSNWKGAMALRVEVYGRTCDQKSEKKQPQEPLMPAPGAAAAAAPGAVPCTPVASKAQCDGRRRRSIKLYAENGYGEGEARLWYAATKGAEKENIAGNSVYVSEGVDFRTQAGSIYAAKDLVAGKSLQIKSWPGFGHGSAEMWYASRAQKTFNANTLYLRNGDLRTQEGSIFAADSVRAGRFLEIQAFPGFGESTAKIWYSATGKGKSGAEFEPETVYLKNGDFATQVGSISSAKDVSASRFLTLKAFPNYGEGEAKFWYVAAGKAPYTSETVYLKAGNLATEAGSVISKFDVEVGQFLRLQALEGFGRGEAKLWYAKDSTNGYRANTLYLENGDLRTQSGSVVADKNLIAGRSLQINAYPGLGSGSAELKFSAEKTDDMEANSLYLKDGDFRTQVGSIIAAKDIGAGNSIKLKSKPGNGEGEAELFYSHSAKGEFDEKTLYLKEGDFKTQDGSIHAGDTLRTSKYLELNAYPGFGEGSVKLWHCNRDIQGYSANSLYLRNGDFRTQDGSIVASKDLVTNRYLTIKATDGYGSGSTKLWFSATGKDEFRSNSLYLTNGDFHTQAGSIVSGGDLTAGKFLKIEAYPGHGTGHAKLWHSKTEHRGFGANTLYLEDGHFQTLKGSLIATKDVRAGRYVKIGAREGYGTGSTSLWYSGSGKEGVHPHTLYVQSGDFRTQDGNIQSAKDVIAGETLYGAKMNVKTAYVPGQITAGHLYLGGSMKAPNSELESALEMIDIPSDKQTAGKLPKQQRHDVAKLLSDLSDSNEALQSKNAELRGNLEGMLARISALEEMSRR